MTWIARTGRSVVDETERRLCGDGAVRSVAVAEGLAAAGRPAATLLGGRDAPAGGQSLGGATGAWVHHRIRGEERGTPEDLAFELVAADAQQAVDHCLVARLIARSLDAPGACTLDREIAAELQLVRLPSDEVLADLADSSVDGDRSGAAGAAFARVAELCGRPSGPVVTHSLEGARVVLVAAGADGRRARNIAAAMAEQDVPAGVVVLSMLRPFPTAEIAGALGEAETVLIVRSPAARAEDWPSEVRRSLSSRETKIHELPGDVDECLPDELSGSLARFLAPELPSPRRLATIGIAPAGDWAEGILLDTAAALGGREDLHLAYRNHAKLSVLTLSEETADTEPSELDLLYVDHPDLIDPGTLDAVRSGGTLLLRAPADAAPRMRPRVAALLRDRLDERRIRLAGIDVCAPGAQTEDPEAARRRLQDALLQLTPTIADSDGDAARIVRDIDPATLDAGAPREETMRMPAPPESVSEDWRTALRAFLLTGRGPIASLEPAPALPLAPVAVASMGEADPAWERYPLSLGDSGKVTSLAALFRQALEELRRRGEPAGMLEDHVDRLVLYAGRAFEDGVVEAPMERALDHALCGIETGLDLSAAGLESLRAEVARLRETIEGRVKLVALSADTAGALYRSTLHSVRRPARAELAREIVSLVERLEDLIRIDDAHGPEGTSPGAIASSLGAPGSLFDADALAESLPAQRGSQRLGPARRGRIQSALDVMRTGVRRLEQGEDLVVVYPGPEEPSGWEGARLVRHSRGTESAIGLFRGIAASYVDLFRAVRVARLDAGGDYDADRHDEMLERFDAEAFDATEMLALPAVAVLESGERLRGQTLHSLSGLLRSGLPIHVLVDERTSDAEDRGREDTHGYHAGLGYLALAHREAFVLQSSLATPAHLVAGLARMATTLRPAIAIVAGPRWQAPVSPWLQLLAARDSRAVPCLRYDPDRGVTFADRFDLEGNLQRERPWPVHELELAEAGGGRTRKLEPFTFAHAAALDPAWRPHFRVIPVEAWSDDQLEIRDFLALEGESYLGRVPFVWVVLEGGELARAVMTRELAFAARDRARAWRILQELAGDDNEHANRAAARARAEALVEAEAVREELEGKHALELEEARTHAASEAMERLAAVLMDVSSQPAAPAPVSTTPAPVRKPVEEVLPVVGSGAAPAAVPEPAPTEDEEEEEAGFDEAFIDSVLCTTCQDCININPRMFKYDGNKQAFIADVTAGTFDELVRAAEKCPARCIHPGPPRDGDETVTDDLIARAAPFN